MGLYRPWRRARLRPPWLNEPHYRAWYDDDDHALPLAPTTQHFAGSRRARGVAAACAVRHRARVPAERSGQTALSRSVDALRYARVRAGQNRFHVTTGDDAVHLRAAAARAQHGGARRG